MGHLGLSARWDKDSEGSPSKHSSFLRRTFRPTASQVELRPTIGAESYIAMWAEGEVLM